jgi:hypothetical protein
MCETQCLVASGMVDLIGLEENAEKTECLLTEQNAEQTECMFICSRQNYNINIASKSSENVSNFKHLEKH